MSLSLSRWVWSIWLLPCIAGAQMQEFATNSTLSLSALAFADAGEYTVKVSNPRSTILSHVSVLGVVQPPYVVPVTENMSVAVNGSPEFGAYVSGTVPLFYQWWHSGTALPDETNAIIRLQRVGLADAGDYWLVVANEGGSASNVFHLNVIPSVHQDWEQATVTSNSCCGETCVQVVNPDGSVYVAHGGGLINYSPAGEVLWKKDESAYGIVPDRAGGIFAGALWSVTHFDSDASIRWRVQSSGQVLATWSNTLVAGDISLQTYDFDGNARGALLPDCPSCSWYEFQKLIASADGGLICAGLVDSGGADLELGIAQLDSAGQTVWVARPGLPLMWYLQDQFDIALASTGSVVVSAVTATGSPVEAFQQITIKLDASGNEVWRGACTAIGAATGVYLAVDGAGQVVAVAAENFVKYSADGRELWRMRSGHPFFGVIAPRAMALDAGGNIYVVGADSSYEQNVVLEKFHRDGQSLWVTALGSAFSGRGLADLDVTADGTIYASVNNDYYSYQDVRMFKFTQLAVPNLPVIVANPEPGYLALSSGSPLTLHAEATGTAPLSYRWLHSASPLGPSEEVIDATNDTLVLTNINVWQAGQYFMEARNPFGYALSRPVIVDVGSPPYFYISDDTRSDKAAVSRVNEGGSTVLNAFLFSGDDPVYWQWVLNGLAIPGATNQSITLTDAAIAQAGVYTLTGMNLFGTNSDSVRLFVETRVKTVLEVTESSGGADEDWAPSYRSPKLAVSTEGEVYLLGTEVDPLTGFRQWFLTKRSPNLLPLWRISSPANAQDSVAVSLVTDGGTNLLVASTDSLDLNLVGSASGLTKIGADGSVLWQTNYPNVDGVVWDAHDLAINAASDIFLTGTEENTLDQTESIYLVKLTAAGERIWERHLPAYAFAGDTPTLATTPDGGVYVASHEGLTRFNGLGELLWQASGYFVNVAVDRAGEVYVTGAQTAKYSSSGELLWSVAKGHQNPHPDDSGVTVFSFYATEKVSTNGTLLWSSASETDTLAVGPEGDTYISGGYYSSIATRRLDTQGSEIWLARKALEPGTWNYGDAVALLPDRDVVTAHLLVNSNRESAYILTRYHQNFALQPPVVRVTPGRALVRPGQQVCFAGATENGNMQLQWFHNGGALMGETNATMCLQADWNTEGDYILNGVTDEGVFVSPNANLQITRPYLYQLSRTQNGQWAITGLALYDRYQPLSLQASSNLINWQVVTNWPYGNSLPFRVELPPQPGTARFFRLNQ